MPSEAVSILWECFRHFVAMDMSNAAINMTPVRYSPITFRLAEAIKEGGWVVPRLRDKYPLEEMLVEAVLEDLDKRSKNKEGNDGE